MRICIDLTSLADNFSGIERFALSITKELIKNNEHQWILLFKNSVHKEFDIDQSNVKKIVIKGKNKLIFNQVILPAKLLTIKADRYFFPAFPAPFFFFNRNAVSTIHDLGCWDCPTKNKKYMTLYFKVMYWKVCLNHKKIITVSEFSKGRIHEILHKNLEEIFVVYNGLSDVFKNFKYDERMDLKAKKDYKLPDKYLLCLSTLEPRKNLQLLVKAYDELLSKKQIDIDLVLAGRKGWLMDDLLANISPETVKRIYFTGFIEDELLPYVYKNASVFVFPSLYEGFGIPPIEAMAMGVPVISSDAASLPEVLGNEVAYFSNNCLDSLENRLLECNKLNLNNSTNDYSKNFNWNIEATKVRKILINGGLL